MSRSLVYYLHRLDQVVHDQCGDPRGGPAVITSTVLDIGKVCVHRQDMRHRDSERQALFSAGSAWSLRSLL